jgi:putative transposase
MPGFRRKPNRLPPPSYHGERFYFLTLCTYERKKIFWNPQLVLLILDLLREKCSAHSFGVYAYCFMPDHLHLVLAGKEDSSSLPRVIRAFKGAAAAEARALGVSRLWQKGFYDHVIRAGEAVDRVAWYVFANPVRAGLVKQIGEWPFSGSFLFDWNQIAAPPEPFVVPWKVQGMPG